PLGMQTSTYGKDALESTAGVRARPARGRFERILAVGCGLHAERMEHAFFDLVIKEVAGYRVGDVADQRERDVLVGVAVADLAGKRHFLELVDQNLIGLILFEQTVIGIV